MTAVLTTRLAPSPTGAQHLGNARTYLIAWLLARKAGGRVVLRIEDIDSPRVKSGATAEALIDLNWLGLDWDSGPIIQSQRIALYENALNQLKRRELVYPCTCTRNDIDHAASAPHADGRETAYPGTCANRSVVDAEKLRDQPFAWRFRPKVAPPFEDRFAGPIRISSEDAGGDFVVWTSHGTPAYQLAVVVDDADQSVTVIVRGDDLIPSTPRQILLYNELDLSPPAFVHVPLVVGPDGRRLAKRHGDTRLSSIRDAGVSAEVVIGLLAWSCGWLSKPVPISAAKLVPLFRLTAIPPIPFVVTPELLAGIGYRR